MCSGNKTAPTYSVGDVLTVGRFFWIKDADFIGFMPDARHGHGTEDNGTGSVDVGCTVKILGKEDGMYVVVLNRPELPYGAQAPIGTVFKISEKELRGWPDAYGAIEAREARREMLEKKYCR